MIINNYISGEKLGGYEKVKKLLDKAVCNPETLHYRDLYSIK